MRDPFDHHPECPQCKEGTLSYTGVTIDTMPPFYTFRCSDCGKHMSVFEEHIPEKTPEDKHECAKCGDWMVRLPHPLMTNPPSLASRKAYKCPSCNYRTTL